MTVRIADDGIILLQGVCAIEDAEALLRHLSAEPGTQVDWSACEHAHTAIIQVLMAVKPKIVGWPTDPFVGKYLTGLFDRSG